MSGPIVRTGTTPAFWKNWEQAFGGKKTEGSAKKKATGAVQKPVVAAKKAAKKAGKKAAAKKAARKAPKKAVKKPAKKAPTKKQAPAATAE